MTEQNNAFVGKNKPSVVDMPSEGGRLYRPDNTEIFQPGSYITIQQGEYGFSEAFFNCFLVAFTLKNNLIHCVHQPPTTDSTMIDLSIYPNIDRIKGSPIIIGRQPRSFASALQAALNQELDPILVPVQEIIQTPSILPIPYLVPFECLIHNDAGAPSIEVKLYNPEVGLDNLFVELDEL